MPEISVGLIQLISTIVVVIFWFARLEFISTQNKMDIAMLKEQQSVQHKAQADLERQIMSHLAEIKIGVAKIEERLNRRGDQ